MATRSYSSKEVSLIIGGTIIKGFESVTVNTTERWNYDHDNQGDAERSEKADYRYMTVDVAMKQLANDQQFLSAYYLAGTPVPFLLRDTNGTDLIAGAQMSIELPSSVTKAKSETTDNTWVLKGNWNLFNIGGNS